MRERPGRRAELYGFIGGRLPTIREWTTPRGIRLLTETIAALNSSYCFSSAPASGAGPIGRAWPS